MKIKQDPPASPSMTETIVVVLIMLGVGILSFCVMTYN